MWPRVASEAAAAVVLALACAPRPTARATPTPAPRPAEAERDARAEAWADATFSPRRAGEASGFAGELERLCGTPDAALTEVAETLAAHQLRHGVPPDGSTLVEAIRRAGAPYVWPRAWTRLGAPSAREATLAAMDEWLAALEPDGERRCGVAVRPASTGAELAAVITADAVADLRPLPVRVARAAWVNVEADLLLPAPATVVVLGPRGRPRQLLASRAPGSVLARFNADQAGPWLVQVLAELATGPRPVLEALVFAGVDPSDRAVVTPGEEAGSSVVEPAAALAAMLDAARRSERLGGLARDARLDRVAQAHAEAMRAAQRLAHDVGNGDPAARLEQAGLPAIVLGENVAHAADAGRAHRALWASPSHRANLLDTRYDSVGIGVAPDDDGRLWVCELFTGQRH